MGVSMTSTIRNCFVIIDLLLITFVRAPMKINLTVDRVDRDAQ